jgi:hypothetical protein
VDAREEGTDLDVRVDYVAIGIKLCALAARQMLAGEHLERAHMPVPCKY